MAEKFHKDEELVIRLCGLITAAILHITLIISEL